MHYKTRLTTDTAYFFHAFCSSQSRKRNTIASCATRVAIFIRNCIICKQKKTYKILKENGTSQNNKIIAKTIHLQTSEVVFGALHEGCLQEHGKANEQLPHYRINVDAGSQCPKSDNHVVEDWVVVVEPSSEGDAADDIRDGGIEHARGLELVQLGDCVAENACFLGDAILNALLTHSKIPERGETEATKFLPRFPVTEDNASCFV